MRILAFDTSSRDVQIALIESGKAVLCRNLAPPAASRQESASMLLPEIDSALKELSWAKADIDLIVVGVGPGSFTGVRVSVVAARSIGQALNLGVLPVSTLEAQAFLSPRPCVVALSAGNNMLFGAAYDNSLATAETNPLIEPFYGSPLDLLSRVAQLGKNKAESLHWHLDSKFPAQIWQEAASAAPSSEWLPKPTNQPAESESSQNLASAAGILACARIAANTSRSELANRYNWANVLPLYLQSPSVTLQNKS